METSSPRYATDDHYSEEPNFFRFLLAPSRSAGQLVRVAMEKQRYWLTFGESHIDRPMLYEMTRQFPQVIFNIRSAKVDNEIGIIAIVLEGERRDIQNLVAWFESEGVQVEPVEIQTIEG